MLDINQPGRAFKREISDLRVGMDFRRPEYRREVFLRFYEFHTRYRAHPGCVYFVLPALFRLYNMTMEERLWFCFINGNTQNPVTSWLIFSQPRKFLGRWFNENYERLEFDIDRRYHKTNFLQAVECYEQITRGGQAAFFKPLDTFGKLWTVVRKSFHTFGRLSAFSYLEYLRIAGVALPCDTLFLDDLSGSKSHRNGLCKVLGRDDLDWHKSNPNGFAGQYAPAVMGWLKEEAEQLLRDAQARFKGAEYFTLESALCTYKSWHRPNRRYAGVYLDMMHDRIRRAERLWPEVDFSIFWQMRRSALPAHLRLEDCPRDPGLCPEKQNYYRETGKVIMMSKEWPCFKNEFDARRLA